jgi:hypothetical protein
MAAGGHPVRVEVRLASQLGDAFGNQIGVSLFFFGVFEELLGYRLRMDTGGHEVMAFVTQDTHDFGRQYLVQNSQHRLPVGRVRTGNGALFHMFTGSPAELLDVGNEWLMFFSYNRLVHSDGLLSGHENLADRK